MVRFLPFKVAMFDNDANLLVLAIRMSHLVCQIIQALLLHAGCGVCNWVQCVTDYHHAVSW